MKKTLLFLLFQLCTWTLAAQVNTDRVLAVGRNALYFEDYVLSIQYFNQVIRAKPWLAEPYYYRAVAKLSLDDFQGAEDDCTLCLERNPFLSRACYARGIARQSMEKYDDAISDYRRGLELSPGDRSMLANRAIAYLQKKDYTEADRAFDELITAYPKLTLGYLTRGAMHLEKGDTALALNDYNKAIEIDPYYAPCYGNRAIILYQTGRMEEALADLNEAIRLNTRENGYYINRGLVRFQLNDLRGAMADYDQVISTDGRNLIARFNRGLLRFQVGDNNRAIEDFDIVIELEPDNYMAYYNRALLHFEVGDYRDAVSDLDAVLNQYPEFLPGYYNRSEAKRKLNDHAGADRDYWTAFELEEKKRKGQPLTAASGQTQTAAPDLPSPDAQAEENTEKTRERSDRNIDKFNRLVVYDREDEQKQQYRSEIRGRVQDRNIRIDLEPSFILTYYEKSLPLGGVTHYDKTLEAFNSRMTVSWKILITNQEAALTEEQIAAHFESINEYSARIEREPGNADCYFGRAMDFMLVQDFAEALHNFDRVIELDPSYTLAYFNRAVVRYKQIEYERSQSASGEQNSLSIQFGDGNSTPSSSRPTGLSARESGENRSLDGNGFIIRDYSAVIRQNPGFVYSYYNRGNIHCVQRDYRAAILDYNEAILRNPEFAEAYFNRGLARLFTGDTHRGIADLSKAGELGLMNAYSIIKRMTAN
ncbi:MAG: tetratricopeptide repeat protein [Tannerella sp.]|jgi:tetratricopeptide (TPR) repeat protein|nr:tetratricopeptide repeat protein [Tannerella sp.]